MARLAYSPQGDLWQYTEVYHTPGVLSTATLQDSSSQPTPYQTPVAAPTLADQPFLPDLAQPWGCGHCSYEFAWGYLQTPSSYGASFCLAMLPWVGYSAGGSGRACRGHPWQARRLLSWLAGQLSPFQTVTSDAPGVHAACPCTHCCQLTQQLQLQLMSFHHGHIEKLHLMQCTVSLCTSHAAHFGLWQFCN